MNQEMLKDSFSPYPKLIIDRVYKTFLTKTHHTTALIDVSLSIQESEFVCFVGPSGCGKSTLLNLIAGLDFPDQGAIFANGKPVIGAGSDRMMMFQESALFPWLNVIDNVLFGLKLKRNLSHQQREELAKFYLRLVGLERFMFAHIHELSGGMKQRVALARALSPNPDILLMDEPFASLDALTREQLYGDIQRIWWDQKKTIVFVTHNVAEAVCLGNRVVLFASSPGKIKEDFPIHLPRPRDIRSLAVAKLAEEITHLLRHHMQTDTENL
jgi:NitT/TauT family transport system ATP-binding protein